MKEILKKLKNPTVLFSVLSQLVALLILLGVKLNEDTAVAVIGIIMSILGTLGIIQKADVDKLKADTVLLPCSNTGLEEPHVLINGKMICTKCGAEYIETKITKQIETTIKTIEK